MAEKVINLEIKYRTFEEERLPQLGVYYVFPKFRDTGICREFSLDIPKFLGERKKVIRPRFGYCFTNESRLLSSLERNRYQATRIEIVGGLSFQMLSRLVAGIHFEEFFKRHEWLKAIPFKS